MFMMIRWCIFDSKFLYIYYLFILSLWRKFCSYLKSSIILTISYLN